MLRLDGREQLPDARLGLRQVEPFAQLGDEELVVGALAAAGRLPAGDEGVYRVDTAPIDRQQAHAAQYIVRRVAAGIKRMPARGVWRPRIECAP